MYLSKIEILGFKSFAQRVELKFDSGVTAIVGPNGCGKTNIVDAIRWVLGEQRYGALRSDKMEDLIFNGTKNRKPLSMAEVSLSIENTKGILPTEYAEVTITRRVYRSGESEYLLNRVPCRLKDILDLFMDTGIGADAYSVIELKMVETILSDNAEERRRLFEEAAGVTKYKHRRRAAYRKLESVQQDLVRVNDIIKEIQKTVNSLERQAKKAEQYHEVSQRLKTIEVDLLEREYAYLQGRKSEQEIKLQQAIARRDAIDQDLAQHDASLDRLRTEVSKTEQALIEVQREAAVQVQKIHDIEDRSLVATERKSSLNAAIERYEKEKVDLRNQLDRLHNERLALAERKLKVVAELEVVQQEYRQKKTDAEAFGAMLSEKKAALQAITDEAIGFIQSIAEKRGEEEKYRTRIEHLKSRIGRAREDNARYALELAQMEERVQRMTAEDKDLRRKFVEAEMKLYQEESRKKQLKEEVDSLHHKTMAVKMEIERKIARMDFLRGLIESAEGASEGTRFLMTQERWKQKQLSTVADVVYAEEKYRVAVEAALGDASTLVVVDQTDEAFLAIEELRKHAKGKSTFVVLKRIPRIRRKRQGIGVPFASDVVQTDPRYRNLVDFLLGDVVVCENMESARRVIHQALGIRCVTLDGQIVTSSGIVRGGSLRQDEGGFIGKQTQMAELQRDVERLKSDLDTLRGAQQEHTQRHDAIDLKPCREEVKSIEKEMTALEINIAQTEFEKKRAVEGMQRNNAEIEELDKEINETQLLLERLSTDVTNLEQAKVDMDRRLLAATADVESLEREWNVKSKTVNDLEVQVATVQGDLRNVERELELRQNSLDDILSTVSRRDTEIAQAHEDIRSFTTELESQGSELAVLREFMSDIESRKQQIEQQYTRQREEMHRIELKIKDDRQLHDNAVEEVHELELKVAELTSNIDHLKERAQKEFEMELQLKTYSEEEWVDFAARREEVRQLKEKIRALGAINFAAFDEFTTESERLRFLVQQRDDLLEAERTLLSTIEEINNTAQKKFLDTFSLIRENFIKIFRELFDPGDECDVRLEVGVDPLEAAIEIAAKPRGKRPTSIELLSGGEKTLTAIALLFAIYLVKPSPFCILDEVDAPLDDSNIDRYTRILHKFSDNTQFIVVTHNKRTMEAANALYGVTMEEEGVSKIVTVRFTEGARVESAAVASGI